MRETHHEQTNAVRCTDPYETENSLVTDLITDTPIAIWLAYTIAAVIQCVLCLVVALCAAAVFIWLGTEGRGSDSRSAWPNPRRRPVRLAATARRRH